MVVLVADALDGIENRRGHIPLPSLWTQQNVSQGGAVKDPYVNAGILRIFVANPKLGA